MTDQQKTALDSILKSHNNDRTHIIAILQDIQSEFRYLPEKLLTYTAAAIGISEAKIYSIATFYENFSLNPKGKYVIRICDGTACHVRKSIPILNEIRKRLSLSETKHTTDDFVFTVETVSCLGACGLAPVLMVNDTVHAAMTPEKANALLNELRTQAADDAKVQAAVQSQEA